LIKEISESRENQTIRVVYSSASMDKTNAMEALNMGVVNFLIKPILKDQIQEKVKAILR
jgi:response regulator of citrate/malate metabolism